MKDASKLPIANLGDIRFGGHGSRLGIAYRAHGDDWVDLVLPYHPDLIGDVDTGVIASGPIVALVDVATSLAIWVKRGRFVAQATLDLRLDYLRAARPGHEVIGHGECYAIKRSISFVRGIAHDGDPADPIAHVAGTYMNLDSKP